ncbi:MAG: hypothetical protein HC866_09885 [Leptolyngbyaceae cyanobacterium RU_5_1]|nr:hypothetical protein [Leptolyngbyaceae cyanobacterium RU_5_1]
MVRPILKSRSEVPVLPVHSVGKGLGVLLTATVLLGSSVAGAFAAPGDSGSSTSGTSDDSNRDVVVDTENQTPGTTPGSTTPGTRFDCQVMNSQYTVMYRPESQPGQAYPWAVPSAMGGGWDPAKRCYEISRRLEFYRPDGLQEMQTAIENGYNTVCVTTQRSPSCRIVLTVPPGQDPQITRDRVFQNLTIADSGQQTQGVNTFVDRGGTGILGEAARWLNIGLPGLGQSRSSASDNINLRPFLDRADGGTGEYLRKGVSSSPGRRLNPNKFR